jgi:hypothetical protein
MMLLFHCHAAIIFVAFAAFAGCLADATSFHFRMLMTLSRLFSLIAATPLFAMPHFTLRPMSLSRFNPPRRGTGALTHAACRLVAACRDAPDPRAAKECAKERAAENACLMSRQQRATRSAAEC